MPLVTSLLTAIVRANGDALVPHAGERPYVVAPSGQLELTPGQSFSVVAARGGDDIWIEIRRHRIAAAIDEPIDPPYVAPDAPQEERASQGQAGAAVEGSQHVPDAVVCEPESEPEPQPMATPDPVVEHEHVMEPEPEAAFELVDADAYAAESEEQYAAPAEFLPYSEAEAVADMPEPEHVPEPLPEPVSEAIPEPRQAVVLPLSRHQSRVDHTTRFAPSPHTTGIDRLLRIAAARGASTLYLTSQGRPSIRVDGQIGPIEGEGTLSEGDVETLILDMIPERNREALRGQAGTEWICDVAEVGRIRCVTFRDHRGPGGIFRMIPARAISAEQLGLSCEIQSLCAEADGLVIVAGQRSSGKSTLISAFVDLINRTRSDHVITIENQITFVHEHRGSLISQREVRGDRNELLSAARAALRENPDVLVVENFGSPEMMALALEAAQSGHLVIGAVTAHSAMDAVDRIIDQAPPEQRAKVQLGLAENLRGIVSQVLLHKTRGGRVAAREVLLNTSAVANLIAEGKTSQLPMAIDSGRKHGMVALNDALVGFVQAGSVDSREAYRQAADQQGYLALLKGPGDRYVVH